MMRELGRLCHAYCADQQKKWAWELQNFAELMNSVIHESTGYSPNELELGVERTNLLPEALRGACMEGEPISQDVKFILARKYGKRRMEDSSARSFVRTVQTG
ncbi:hypothetical protein JTB14_019635 [Gonioctena quinquepunctata]|nr:hypothetical protein JTB14_019635 [Gonioctena quinquepunctata]